MRNEFRPRERTDTMFAAIFSLFGAFTGGVIDVISWED